MFPGRLTPETIREIAAYAKSRKKDISGALEGFEHRSAPWSYWLEAALLEQGGRNEEAAAVLEALTDSSFGEERALRLLGIARNRKTVGQELAQAARCATANRTLIAIDKMLAGRMPEGKRKIKIALVGTVTLELWVPALRALCFSWGIGAEIYVGQFQQYTQEILDPESGMARFGPDLVMIAADWRSLALANEVKDPEAVVEAKLAGFRPLWRHCREKLGANAIQCNFEVPEVDPLGSLGGTTAGGRGAVIRRINQALAGEGVAILDVEQIASLHGKQRWNDEALWQAAKQYPSTEAIPLLMRHTSALIRASLGLTSKCLALDLDNTLWGGVIGEDGVGGIRLGGSAAGEAFVTFQRYVQALQRRGIVLAVCSKNNEPDAKAPFLEHPEMVLKLDDIAVFAANWQSKDENLRQIAATLNIGLDSIVFVDDNPVERNLIRRLLPEVEVPEMPQDPADYAAVLHRSLCFEPWSITDDDRRRARTYRENVQRQEQMPISGNVEEYLASLDMEVELRPFDTANLGRIVQLINKTNQFNLTTRRMMEAECVALMGRADCYTQFMRLRDRFGDNGITGVLIAFIEDGNLRIDNWLLSCRVLGRRVEDAMLAAALNHGRARGCEYAIGEYLPTAKNGQVSGIFEKYGFEPHGPNRFRCRIATHHVAAPGWMRITEST
jgi:FkbH-like protein